MLLHPTAVLFNGGVMKGDSIRERVMGLLNAWLVGDGAAASARARGRRSRSRRRAGRGCLWAGEARQGTPHPRRHGARLLRRHREPRARRAGHRAADHGALPRAVRHGGRDRRRASAARARRRRRRAGDASASSARRCAATDRAGTELETWKEGELEELAPIEVTLPAEGRSAGDVVPVRLHASVTEVGTLLLEAVPTQPRKPDERWRVELSVRSE